MPTPTFVGFGTLSTATPTTTPDPPSLPSGWAVGDVHFLMVRRVWDDPKSPTSGQSGPDGWTLEVDVGPTNSTNGQEGRFQVWSRRAESGDGAPSVTIGDETTLTCRVYGWRDVVWWESAWTDVVAGSVWSVPYQSPSLTIPENRAGFLVVLSAGGVLSDSAAPPFQGGPRTVYNGWTPTHENPPFFISSAGAGNGTTFRRADSPGTFPGPSLVSQTQASFAVAAFTLSAVPRPPTAAVFVGGATRVAVAPT